MKFSRGLAALILTSLFQTSLFSQYLYKDEVVNNPKFNNEIETLGAELYEKTGISLRLIMIRDIPNGEHIVEYEKKIIQKFSEPTILLTFAELNSKVDIYTNDTSLYKYFNKEQILSPVASTAQAVAMAILFAENFDNFQELLKSKGGTILPLLADKTKAGQHVNKYSAAMFNGYLDLAEQIAISKNIDLSMATGQASENIMLGIKIIFYSIIVISLVFYVRKKYLLRGKKNEI